MMKRTRKKLFPVLAAVLLIVMALAFAGSALAYSEAEVGNGEEGFSEEGSNSEEEPKEPPVPEEAPEKSDPPETEENVGVSPDTEPEATGEPVPDEEVKPEASPETSMEPTLIEQEEAVPDAEENAVLMPASIITDGLAANEVMVSSFADLKTVLTDYSTYAGIDTVYLNGDIVYEPGGIAIHASRSKLTIVGHPKGGTGRHTVSDIAGGQGNLIRPQQSGFSLTVKDAVIAGKNYYGAFTVSDSYSGVTTSYVNVSYHGPQFSYNRRGLVRYIDTSITIANTGGDPAQEIAELAQLEIGGNTTLTNTAGGNAMFWFAGNSGSNQYFKVLDGANVTAVHNSANSPYGFIYVEGSGGTANQKPEVTVGTNASLSVTTKVGFTHSGYRVESITVQPGGTLTVAQTSNSGDYPSIYVNSSVTVREGGTLSVKRGANTSSNGLVRFYNAGGVMKLDAPRRILLYNPNGRLITTNSGTAAIEGSIQAVNVWDTDKGFTDSMENMPKNIWNKNDSGAMELKAVLNTSGVTSAVISNRTEDDPFTAEFNAASFNTYAMPMLAMGSYTLEPDTVYTNSTGISGSSRAGAKIQVGYQNAGTAQKLSAEADSSGRYDMAIPDAPLSVGTKILTLCHSDFLKVQKQNAVQLPPAVLEFETVPDILFQTTISALPQTVQRTDADWAMSVYDTRGAGSMWRIEAAAAHPLTGLYNGSSVTLPEALVFIDEEGGTHPLENGSVVVREGTTGNTALNEVRWQENEGILVSLNGGEGKPGVTYKTTIEWTLVDAP